MINIKQVLLGISPFPLVLPDKTFADGLLYSRSPMCHGCRFNVCVSELGKNYPSVCPNGNMIMPFNVSGSSFVICGIVTDSSQHKLEKSIKNQFAHKLMRAKYVSRWVERVVATLVSVEAEAQELSVENLEAFHDVLPSISIIQRAIENIISAVPGKNFEDRLENVEEPVRNLYKSAEILKERVNLMPLLTNPTSATLGGKGRRSIFKLIDTLARSFRSLAAEKGATISIVGASRNMPLVYKSFSAIPFVLLDNAVKYSVKKQKIDVAINDASGSAIDVSFQSFGPVVPEEDRDRIFDRKMRYSPKGSEPQKGSGLGLYIASHVARVHGFKINYNATNLVELDGIPCGLNSFGFTIPDGDS